MRNKPVIDMDRAALRLLLPHDGTEKFRAPGAKQSSDAKNFSSVEVERDPMQVTLDAEIADRQQDATPLYRRSAGIGLVPALADDETRDRFRRILGDRNRANQAAIAQHGDIVSNLRDFV